MNTARRFFYFVKPFNVSNVFQGMNTIFEKAGQADAALDLSVLENMITNKGEEVRSLSEKQPVLLVFLRHFGCIFCREALKDLAERQDLIKSEGSKLILVHMSDYEIADRYLQQFGLHSVDHVSDPTCRFYAAFGLSKGNFTQLFGLQAWIRGFSVSLIEGHSPGPILGDAFQMPGVFVVYQSAIKDQFIHKLASDRPDYLQLIKCCSL